jgi:hypothetical protein
LDPIVKSAQIGRKDMLEKNEESKKTCFCNVLNTLAYFEVFETP